MIKETNQFDDQPDAEASRARSLESHVAAFISLHEEGEGVALDAYCDRCPDDLRDEVKAHCESYLEARAVLSDSVPASKVAGTVERDVLGDFRLIRELGRGGMGVVYLAKQESLGRLVALKVLPPHLTRSEAQVERFRRESRKAGALKHPAIVPVYTVGECDDHHYYAMEYVEGTALGDEIQHRRDTDRPFDDPAYPAHVAMQLAEALQYSHESGVIHRDIKPHNVMLDHTGEPRLVDFGLALDPQEEGLTRTDEVAGTYHYMSPEQAGGSRELTAASDVYSLCVVLYEMLTLERPIDADTPTQLLARIPLVEPRPITELQPHVPKDLDTICRKGLAKLPHHRYSSAGALAEDLRRFLRHEAIHARPPSTVERAARFVRARRRGLAVAAFLIALGVLATGTVAMRWQREARVDRFLRQTETRLEDPVALAQRFLDAEPSLFSGAAVSSTSSSAPSAVELRDLAVRLRAVRADVSDEKRRQIDDWLGTIRSVGVVLKERGMALAGMGIAGVEIVDGGDETASVNSGESLRAGQLREASTEDQLLGLHLMREAAVLLDDDMDLREVIERAGLATLILRSDPDHAGAAVDVRRMDRLSGRLGPIRRVGVLPLEVGLPVGFYRVAVEGMGRRLELHVDLREAATEVRHHVDLATRAGEGALRAVPGLDDMIAIAGGRYEFSIKSGLRGDDEPWLPRVVDIASFRIDRGPVTNGQYAAFLEQSERSEPAFWIDADSRGDGSRGDDWADRPVVGVSLADARAFAAWAGKRLPTAAEWEWAMGRVDGGRFPWGDDAGRIDEFVPGSYGERLRAADHATIVALLDDWLPANGRSAVLAGGPRGFQQVFGGVWEWTETVHVEWIDDTLRPNPTFHHLRGGSWFSLNRDDLARLGVQLTAFSLATHGQFDYGFRCVVSEP